VGRLTKTHAPTKLMLYGFALAVITYAVYAIFLDGEMSSAVLVVTLMLQVGANAVLMQC
jgi:multisubunit Na+/H+ antiporter MnhG subunit